MTKAWTIGVAVAIGMYSALVHAEDLTSLRNCIDHGYAKLSNRHAIIAAAIDANNSEVLRYGAAQLDQLFEIGSVTKTFTANLLAQEVIAGKLKLSDAIPTEYQKTGKAITYQHLTTHTSGIIGGIFPGFQVTNPLSPFEGLTIPIFKDLYGKTPLDAEPGSNWSYSNIGESVLGQVLATRFGGTYEEAVATKILHVLHMDDTFFQVPDDQLKRFPRGRMIGPDGEAQDIPHWDLYKTAIDPAGGLRSTIGDMVKYTRANLLLSSSPLMKPITLTHQPLYFIKDFGQWIGMNWIINPKTSLVWHNGETYGFNSIVAFSNTRGQAVVAMTDTTVLTKIDMSGTTFDTSLQDIAFECLK